MRNATARRRCAALGSAVVLAVTTGLSILAGTSPAQAATLDVSYTLEGCRPGTYDQIAVLCADDDYTTGNLGKSWSELDLVPFRVTLDNNAASSRSGVFTVAGDYKNGAGTATGWDVVSVLTLNTDLSEAGCPTVTSGAQTITPPGAGVGGADQTIYRKVSATIPAGTTCVYDYYMRLALGAHNFSGSSLQGNLWNENLDSAGVGQKRVSIPVNEIAPQELSKTMEADRNSDFVWTLEKTAPVRAVFADTCNPDLARTLPLDITLSWTKHDGDSSGYTVTTVVTAVNPALRTITVQATDAIYAGAILLDTEIGAEVDVPANTSMPVLVHEFDVTPAELAALLVPDPDNPSFNDIATATYIDKLTGVPVPGTTQATASVANGDIGTGTVTGDSIVVTDSESITGAGLDFSVAEPSVGSFTNYTAGDFTTGPVDWTSGTQTSSGTVTFNKTVRVTEGTATSGVLSDTAEGTFDSSTVDAAASTDIDASALVDLTINKRRSPVTSEAQTFDFEVVNAADETVASPSITIPGGAGVTTDFSATVNDLLPGTYSVNEPANPPYGAQTQDVTLALPSCAESVSFDNQAEPARARVQKATVPDSTTSWEFTLSGPDVGVSGTEVVNATAGAGFVDFDSSLATDGATYTITETPQTGYDPTGIAGNFAGDASRVTTNVASRTCSFTLDLPEDSGGVLSCSFTNTQRASITIIKNAIPDDAQDFQFVSDIANFQLDDDADPELSNTKQFLNLVPGSYFVREALPVQGWKLTGLSCQTQLGSVVTITLATALAGIDLAPGDSVTCTFTNTKQGKAKLIKTVDGAVPSGSQAFTFQIRSGATVTQSGTILESGVANAANGGVVDFATELVPGQTYQFCEIIMPGWSSTLGTFVPDSFIPPDGLAPNPNVDNSIVCVNFTVAAGETKTFTVDNSPPPGGRALTIGFWKNWSSCSGGKQAPVLDQTLAAMPGGGILFGDLFINTCLEATRILNKSTVNTGKKMSSDPLYNMAAQLLAAQLNFQAGAGKCGAAITASNQALALLDKYNFNGTSSYTKVLSKADTTLANSLANTLDRYNNNLLC